MRRACLLSITLLFSLSTCLLSQGLNTRVTKDDWEEINFEFNSAVLSDGYPSLLRLAELLQAHPDYKVKVEGHTDFVGSDTYNNRLALARSEMVRDFLIKYGARPNQIEASGRGKANPEVDNRTAEGRFMNRRVVLTVTDGQGRQVSAGGVGSAIKAMEPSKMADDCCNQILKKLDDIMAMLRDLKRENDDLKNQVAGLKAPQPVAPPTPMAPQAPAPRPLDKKEVEEVASAAAAKAVDAGKTKKFSLLGVNVGPDTNNGNASFTGKGRFFTPFNDHLAFQAEGEYLYYHDRQEGQFDFGLVNRYKSVQAGLFSSFKHVNIRDFQQGGTLGQGAFTLDYIFHRGRLGFFGTKAFMDGAVVNRTAISGHNIQETYLRAVDQVGASTQVALFGNSYVEGNLGALFSRGGENKPGGTVRFVQPINSLWAFTVEAGLNETLVGKNNNGRVVFGLQLGHWIRPKEFAELKHPVPVDIPRLRYEVLTRQVRNGNDPPVADAGPDQVGVKSGTIALDGSRSFDPDGDPITFQWTQILGPAVTLSNATSARTTFAAADGTTYIFQLTVKDDHGGVGTAKATVVTTTAVMPLVVQFAANPPLINAGQTSTLNWQVQNADQVTITPDVGKVDPKAGTATVAPTATTIYKLTATNSNGEVNQTVTVTVNRPAARILSFQATPTNIASGQASTLAWQTENADQVTISGIGTVQANGTSSVSPTQTTTYTLTAQNRFGSVNATVTVTVGPLQVPRIIRFTATPRQTLSGGQATLAWQVVNATNISISGIGTVQATGTAVVSPTTDTTYTLTASNARGQVTATVMVAVVLPVKILSFTATPSSISKPGDPVKLSWTTENATQVVISTVGTVPVNGSVTVNPTSTTTYSMVAYGKSTRATANASVTVTVTAAPATRRPPPIADAGPPLLVGDPVAHLNGSKSYDPDGGPITYSWTVLGSRRANITGWDTATPTVQLLSGTGTYTFQLTVRAGAEARATAIAQVQYNDPLSK